MTDEAVTWDSLQGVDMSGIVSTRREGVADPQADIEKLAEHIAARAGYPQADKECWSIARKMFHEVGDIDRLLAAYDRLEKSNTTDETFFVKIALQQSAGWQMRQIISEAKRGAPKKRSWMDGFENCVNR